MSATPFRFAMPLDVPAEAAWRVLRDFGSLLHWVRGGDVGTLTVSGDGPGMVRDFTLPRFGTVQHRLDAVDEAAHAIVYSLTAGRPLGMADYWTRIALTDIGGGRCRIDWTAEFRPHDGVDPAAIAAGLEESYRDMSERLAAYARGL
jgi:carbon monoxide dehydrogenase subunit G